MVENRARHLSISWVYRNCDNGPFSIIKEPICGSKDSGKVTPIEETVTCPECIRVMKSIKLLEKAGLKIEWAAIAGE